MKNNHEIRWGILGCGDVCEVKSGPAFNKVDHSTLVAVMRRDADKAKDFARRHQVPRYYTDADALIADDSINAIYIATPPAFHEDYALRAMQAGKPVYVEKPVSLNSDSCRRMLAASKSAGVKVSVAHYRRALPIFIEIKALLQSGIIGKPSLIIAKTLQGPTDKMKGAGYWRTDPEISGGGLFFDLAPHQLDIFYWLFGEPRSIRGFSMNQKKTQPSHDMTNLEAVFDQDIYLHGIWSFNIHPSADQEYTEILGDKGKIAFSFFRTSDIAVTTAEGVRNIAMEYPENIQLPMIDRVVKYFQGQAPNPCSLEDALISMEMMDATL